VKNARLSALKILKTGIILSLISAMKKSKNKRRHHMLKYRTADLSDLPAMMKMVEEAKEGFRTRNIDQWQKGEPNEQGLTEGIKKGVVHVLEENGKVLGMVTVVPGPEADYAAIGGAWLNDEPYFAFHRVCVSEAHKGKGLAGSLFSHSEIFAKEKGVRNIRIDTHPDNLSMQKALTKNGYTFCGKITLCSGSEAGDPRFAYQKILN
jgi:ribosomal protein S18 acetylase RimI-like enzyme